LINRGRTQGCRQLDGKTVAWLIPIRAQRWERSVAPEIAGCARVRPGLVGVFNQQIHILGDIDITANTVLPSVNWLQKGRNPVCRTTGIGIWKDSKDGETGRT